MKQFFEGVTLGCELHEGRINCVFAITALCVDQFKRKSCALALPTHLIHRKPYNGNKSQKLTYSDSDHILLILIIQCTLHSILA